MLNFVRLAWCSGQGSSEARIKMKDTGHEAWDGEGKDMSVESRQILVKPVYALLDEAVAHYTNSPAMDFLGRSWTYKELGDQVSRAAAGFRHLGVRKGVRVGLCLPNTPYFVVCYYAILKAGGTVVNYNPLYVERELKNQILDSGTSIMVTLDLKQIYPKVAAMLDETSLDRIVVCSMTDILPKLKGMMYSVLKRSELADIPEDLRHVSFGRLLGSGTRFREEVCNPTQDIAVLQYTGGTTGVPKGAVLTHANLTANVDQLRSIIPADAVSKGGMVCALPLFHVFAMTAAMNLGIHLGCELILLPRFELKQVMKTIGRKRPRATRCQQSPRLQR